MKLIAAILAITLMGCAQVTPPPGQENQREFTQEFDKAFIDVYRVVVRQMTDCYLGPGSKVLPELDTANKRAQIETSLTRGSWDRTQRMVVIEGLPNNKTKVTTSGKTPSFVYGTHTMIPKWLSGSQDCT